LLQQRRCLPHLSDQLAGRFALVAGELAADEIVRLNAVRSLIDRGDPRVAQILRRIGLFDIAHPACTWIPVEATATPKSVHQALTTGISKSARRCARKRSATSGWRRDRSIIAAA